MIAEDDANQAPPSLYLPRRHSSGFPKIYEMPHLFLVAYALAQYPVCEAVPHSEPHPHPTFAFGAPVSRLQPSHCHRARGILEAYAAYSDTTISACIFEHLRGSLEPILSQVRPRT